MKKVLIWDDFPMSNIGGPMGYCYNIHEYLKDHPTKQITFCPTCYRKGKEVHGAIHLCLRVPVNYSCITF